MWYERDEDVIWEHWVGWKGPRGLPGGRGIWAESCLTSGNLPDLKGRKEFRLQQHVQRSWGECESVSGGSVVAQDLGVGALSIYFLCNELPQSLPLEAVFLISPCLCGRSLGVVQPDSHNSEPSQVLIISKLCWGKRFAPSLLSGWFEGLWCPQCCWPESASVPFHRAAFNTAFAFIRGSPRQRKTEIVVIYNLISESAAHHFCCILLMRSTELLLWKKTGVYLYLSLTSPVFSEIYIDIRGEGYTRVWKPGDKNRLVTSKELDMEQQTSSK